MECAPLQDQRLPHFGACKIEPIASEPMQEPLDFILNLLR
jgi:hypothetical protein